MATCHNHHWKQRNPRKTPLASDLQGSCQQVKRPVQTDEEEEPAVTNDGDRLLLGDDCNGPLSPRQADEEPAANVMVMTFCRTMATGCGCLLTSHQLTLLMVKRLRRRLVRRGRKSCESTDRLPIPEGQTAMVRCSLLVCDFKISP